LSYKDLLSITSSGHSTKQVYLIGKSTI
jgi:hypothetical protein